MRIIRLDIDGSVKSRWVPFLSLLICMVFGATRSSGQSREIYSLVELDTSAIPLLSQLLTFDSHLLYPVDNHHVQTILSAGDVAQLRSAGEDVEIRIADISSYYIDRNSLPQRSFSRSHNAPRLSPIPLGFVLGSKGGYLTLEELATAYVAMKSRYPDLVSIDTIGYTQHGRPLTMVEIGKGEKESRPFGVLYTGLHHAREPMSMMSLIYFMWDLLERSSKDEVVDQILATTTLYFVPVVNPDGYQFNLDASPVGGGMWRKNNEGHDGVDLNRNYGEGTAWTTPPVGQTSSDPLSDLYRGPRPFSENETGALRTLLTSNTIDVVVNYHALSNVFIQFGDTSVSGATGVTWYEHASAELARENGFGFGRGERAIGYESSGTSDAWISHSLASTTQRPIATWSPEIGSPEDGLWPPVERIIPLCQNLVSTNIVAAQLASGYLTPISVRSSNEKDGYVVRILFENVGMRQLEQGTTVSLDRPDFTPVVVPPLQPGELFEVLWHPLPEDLLFERAHDSLQVVVNGATRGSNSRTFDVTGADQKILFEDDFENGLSRWATGLWGLEVSGGRGSVLADSPYQPMVIGSGTDQIEMIQQIDLNDVSHLTIQFEASRDLLGIFDGAFIGLKMDGADTVIPLAGDYSSIAYTPDVRTTFRGSLRSWRAYTFHIPVNSPSARLVLGTTHPLNVRADGIGIDNIRVIGSRNRPSNVDETEADDKSLEIDLRNRIVRIQSGEVNSIDLYSITGVHVLHRRVQQHDAIDLSEIPSGSYAVQIERRSGELRRRMITLY